MDFEFKKNIFLGEYYASFNMEHQLFGRLFEEELKTDRTKIDQIMMLSRQAETQILTEQKWLGHGLTLTFYDGEVSVMDNALYQDDAEVTEEGMTLYNSEGAAVCGLEDFQNSLQEWKEFVSQ